jgi:hypothetical protein
LTDLNVGVRGRRKLALSSLLFYISIIALSGFVFKD